MKSLAALERLALDVLRRQHPTTLVEIVPLLDYWLRTRTGD